jgi:ribosome-associated protein
MIFEIQHHDFIPLNNLLKVMNLVETGGEANACIMAGEVKLNGAVVLEKRKKIRAGDVVTFDGKKITVK